MLAKVGERQHTDLFVFLQFHIEFPKMSAESVRGLLASFVDKILIVRGER